MKNSIRNPVNCACDPIHSIHYGSIRPPLPFSSPFVKAAHDISGLLGKTKYKYKSKSVSVSMNRE